MKMRVNKISIITPSFNQARFLERTIESVIRQQLPCELEYIVVDGLSTDGTSEILKKYEHRLTYISEADSGMTEALNKGFSMATGEIFAWLNSDDVYLPGALEKVIYYFNEHPDCQWLYGKCLIINENDRETRKWITFIKTIKSKKFNYKKLLIQNYISQPAVFFTREAFQKAGCIDQALPTAMDYDLWLRLAKLGKPGIIQDFIAGFRVHPQSISAGNYRKQFKEQYQIHLRYDRHGWRLLQHRLMIMMIVSIYDIFFILGRISGRKIKS